MTIYTLFGFIVGLVGGGLEYFQGTNVALLFMGFMAVFLISEFQINKYEENGI